MNQDTEDPGFSRDDPACKAAAKALVVAADRLHRAIAAASPERGQELLATLRLAGATPVVTILQTDGAYTVHAGLGDKDTARNLETFHLVLVRSDRRSGLDLQLEPPGQ